MSLYHKLARHATSFSRLFGVKIEKFRQILAQLEPIYAREVTAKYKRPGTPTDLDLLDQLLLILLCYRSNISYLQLSIHFDLHPSQICRYIRRLEPLLVQVLPLKKAQKISADEVSTLLVDATEQHINRPKKSQQTFYSGKKKAHTLKSQIIVTARGQIVAISRPYSGKNHDFNICKREMRKIMCEIPAQNPEKMQIHVDSGYQGLQKLLKGVLLPHKASKNNPLDLEKKIYNRKISRIRVKVEHIFAQMKKYRILSEKYRGKIARYGLKTRIIAGLVNLHNGFTELCDR